MRHRILVFLIFLCCSFMLLIPKFQSASAALLAPSIRFHTALSGTPSSTPSVPPVMGVELKRVGSGVARAAAWSPDSETLAVGTSLGMGLFTSDLKPIVLFNTDDEITALAWNPNGKQIATASRGRAVQLWDVASGKVTTLQTTPSADETFIGSVSYNTDGTLLASASADQNAAQIWDTASGKLVATLRTANPVYAVAWRANTNQVAVGGSQLVTATDSQTGKSVDVARAFAQIWDVSSSQMIVTMPTQGGYSGSDLPPVATLQWYASGKRLLVNSRSSGLPFFGWVIDTQEVVDITLFGVGSRQGPASFSPDSVNVAAAIAVDNYSSEDSIDILVDSEDEANIEAASDGNADKIPAPAIWVPESTQSTGSVRAIVWAADNRTFADVRDDGTVGVHYLASRGQITTSATTDLYKEQPYDAAWGRNPNRLSNPESLPTDFALAVEYEAHVLDKFYYDVGVVNIRNVLSHHIIDSINVNTPPLSLWGGGFIEPTLSPDFAWMVTGLESGPGEEGGTLAVVPISGSAPSERQPITLDMPDQLPPADGTNSLPSYRGLPFFYVWSRDSSQIATIWRGYLVIWEAATGRVQTSVAFADFFPETYWNPNGQALLFISNAWHNDLKDTNGVMLDAKTGKQLYRFSINKNVPNDVQDVQGVSWEPNGTSFAIVNNEGEVRIWKAASGQLLQTFEGRAIEWSPDGQQFAIAHLDRSVTIYDTKTAKIIGTLRSSTGDSLYLAFSPDGKRLLTCESSGFLQLWDIASGQLVKTFAGHRGPVLWAKWKPDGSQILSRGDDGTLRLWRSDG